MPSNVVRRNLKSKQATARKRATSQNKKVAQKKRVVAKRRVAVRKVSQRKVSSRSSRAVGIALAVFLAMNPGMRKVFAAGHPSPAPSPSSQASVKNSKLTTYYSQNVGDSRSGFFKYRLSQKLTKRGPVLFFEQGRKIGKKPFAGQIGLAQGIKIKGDVLVKAGLLTHNIGKEKIDLAKADFGLVLSKSGFSAELHHFGKNDATRYSGSANIKGVNVDASYMQQNYFTKQSSTRIGATKLEKVLGINLKKLSTDMGITHFKGKNPQLDVGFFVPGKIGKVSGGIGANAWGLGTGKEGFSGVIVIKF